MICRPPHLRSGGGECADPQFAENKDGRKISHHISRLGTTDVEKAQFGRLKKQLSSKMARFAGKFGIDLMLIFCTNDFFCAILSF